MHDLNAKKLKHDQAVRNTDPQPEECHKPSKWDNRILIVTCLLFIALLFKGV